jgi:hypothetical protein
MYSWVKGESTADEIAMYRRVQHDSKADYIAMYRFVQRDSTADEMAIHRGHSAAGQRMKWHCTDGYSMTVQQITP